MDTSDRFTPSCAGCLYDLTGLANPEGRGVCPECGWVFDVAELRRQRNTRKKWSPSTMSPAVCMTMVLAACLLFHPILSRRAGSPWGIDPDSEACVLGGIWLLSLVWMLTLGRELWRPPRCWLLCLLAGPIIRTTLGIPVGGNEHLKLSLAVLATSLAVAAIVWFLIGRRWWHGMPILLGLYIAIPGLLMLLTNIGSPARHWSQWPDPRPGQVHQQYPLTLNEARFVGITLAGVGGALAMVTLISSLRRYAPPPPGDAG